MDDALEGRFSVDQRLDPLSDMTIDVTPRVARGFANARHNLLITGFVSSRRVVGEVSLWADGKPQGRIVYGQDSGQPASGNGDATGRLRYEFAFNLIRDLNKVENRIDISILARADDDEEKRTNFHIRVDPSESGMASVDRACTRDDGDLGDPGEFERSPMLLYVEDALTDGRSRVKCSGWVVSVAPILAVQMFHGERRIGLARTGFDRYDVAAQYPMYPNPLASGFVFDLTDTGLAPGMAVTVQAIARSGNAYEIVMPLAAWTTSAADATPPIARDASPVAEMALARSPRVESAITLSCEEAILSTSGLLRVGGWCLGDEDIAAVYLHLDGADAGMAELGHPRPDVAEAHPDLPRASRAGFRFSRPVADAIDAARPHALLIVARDRAGNEKRQALLLHPVADPIAISGEAEPRETCKLVIDNPALTLGAMNDPVTDRLQVDGWALARNGVRSIEIDLDGASLGPAFHGQRREDIAAAFPGWDNALLSGFAFCLPARTLSALKPGEHRVQVRLVTRDGEEAVHGFSFIHEKPSDLPETKLFLRHPRFAERQLLKRMLEATDWNPMFSILVVTDDGPGDAERLRATLRSLRSQIHGRWHATVVTISAASEEMFAAAQRDLRIPPERIEQMDGREETVRRRSLASFSRETGPALLAVIRAGDELAADAMAEMALASWRFPKSDIFTCDDIRHDRGRNERDPFHKPAWSPDLLLSCNYIGRFWCARAELLGRVQATMGDVLDFGDYDLILRATEHATAIRHVARLLFQQAGEGESDERERAALDRAIVRRGLGGEVLPGHMPGVHRVRRATSADTLVSIIIPTAGAKGHIERCLVSLRQLTRHARIEIICIDNIPEGNSALKAWLRDNADRVMAIDEAFNWSLFNNIAAGQARGEYLLFLNDDTEVINETWLESLLEHAQRPEVGVVGPRLLYPDGKVQHAGLFLTGLGAARHAFRFLDAAEPGYFGLSLTQRNVTAVTGACMLVRRDVFDALRGFDEAHAVINNDVDFCLRARRQALLVVYTPYSRLIHHELASRAELKDDYHSPAFEAEWSHVFAEGDPYFSPHLSKAFDDYRREDEITELVHAGHPLYDRAEIRRILAVKLDHIGDFVTALPALRRLKRHFPEAELHVLAGKAARHIAPLEPGITDVFEFEFFHARSGLGRMELTVDALLRLRATLEPYAFDLAVDLRKHSETRPILRYTGARLLAGFDTQDEYPWLDIAVEWEVDRKLHAKRQHVTDDLIRLVDAIAIAGEPHRACIEEERRPAPLKISALPAAARELFSKPVAIVHPGVGQETRQWPPAYFATLIDMLAGRLGLNVALIGSDDEDGLAREVMAATRERASVVSLVGRIPLADLPRLLARATLYVGNNSGPKHIAAALGIPTVGIHSGVVDATEWGPLGTAAVAIRRDMSCSPCYIASLSQCFRHFACMRGLEPASVFAICERMLLLGGPGIGSDCFGSGTPLSPDDG